MKPKKYPIFIQILYGIDSKLTLNTEINKVGIANNKVHNLNVCPPKAGIRNPTKKGNPNPKTKPNFLSSLLEAFLFIINLIQILASKFLLSQF